MSKTKKQNENGENNDEGTSTGPAYETFYDDESPRGSSWKFDATGAVCGVLGGLRDTVLKTLPVEVTEHLVNGEKELIKAGIALAESQIRTADKTLNRARDLNKDKGAA